MILVEGKLLKEPSLPNENLALLGHSSEKLLKELPATRCLHQGISKSHIIGATSFWTINYITGYSQAMV